MVKSPADFSIQLFDTPSLSSALSHDTAIERHGRISSRRKYARIRLVDTGVRTPSWSGADTTHSLAEPVPFIVLLEPLYLGLLPLSIVPTVLFLAPLCIAALIFAHYVTGQLSNLADKARVELEAAQRPDKSKSD